MSNKTHISQIDVFVAANHIGSGAPLAVIGQGDVGFLAAAGVVYGNVIWVGGYTHLCGYAFSDVASATNGLVIEQGMKSTDFDTATPASETDNITRSRYNIAAADIDNNAFNSEVIYFISISERKGFIGKLIIS